MENTKIGAYATSHLKCDNEIQPRKITSLSFFVYFYKLLILEMERFVPLKFCNVPLLVVHGENGKKASNLS